MDCFENLPKLRPLRPVDCPVIETSPSRACMAYSKRVAVVDVHDLANPSNGKDGHLRRSDDCLEGIERKHPEVADGEGRLGDVLPFELVVLSPGSKPPHFLVYLFQALAVRGPHDDGASSICTEVAKAMLTCPEE